MSEADKEDSEQEPKIIVDTDWKEQIAKEKEAAQAEGDAGDQAPDDGAEEVVDAEPAASTGDQHSSELPPPPPASFEMLVSMLFTQAMAALGQIPDPTSGEAKVSKPYAKHYIDTLDMLSEKTTGNLSDTESKMVDEALHALRMTYVNTK